MGKSYFVKLEPKLINHFTQLLNPHAKDYQVEYLTQFYQTVRSKEWNNVTFTMFKELTMNNQEKESSIWNVIRNNTTYLYDQFKQKNEETILGHVDAKAIEFRQQYEMIKKRIGNVKNITPISSLLGVKGDLTVLGLLTRQSRQNQYFLEDLSDLVEIKLTNNPSYSDIILVEGSFVLMTGQFNADDKIFVVKEIDLPPIDTDVDQQMLARSTLFGLSHQEINDLEQNHGRFIILQDVALDQPAIRVKLRRLFEGYNASPEYVPDLIIMVGSFISFPYEPLKHKSLYKANFDELGRILDQYNNVKRRASFLFIPGPNDPTLGSFTSHNRRVYPAASIPKSLTTGLKLNHCKFETNPCSIRFQSKLITIWRENNILSYEHMNLLHHDKPLDMFEKTAELMIRNGHILPLNQIPRYWSRNSTLRLIPRPDLFVLANEYLSSQLKEIHQTKVINVGGFSEGTWVEYSDGNLCWRHLG